jgi:hypothetical protein
LQASQFLTRGHPCADGGKTVRHEAPIGRRRHDRLASGDWLDHGRSPDRPADLGLLHLTGGKAVGPLRFLEIADRRGILLGVLFGVGDGRFQVREHRHGAEIVAIGQARSIDQQGPLVTPGRRTGPLDPEDTGT